jgi:ABC-type Fe3+-siderophore transport system permease subunit
MLLAHTEVVYTATQSGIGLGSAIAVVLSWHRNRSIILAAIAGFFTWLYVIYFAVTRRPDEYLRP